MDSRMAKGNEADGDWVHDRSPKGVHESFNRFMCNELTAVPDLPPDAPVSLHPRPFEVDLVRLAPGKKNCPLHGHSAQWEYYIVLSGHGQMLQQAGVDPLPMGPGDHLVQPPGWVHTVENHGEEDLTYYVIADNPVDDTCWYPDSGK